MEMMMVVAVTIVLSITTSAIVTNLMCIHHLDEVGEMLDDAFEAIKKVAAELAKVMHK